MPNFQFVTTSGDQNNCSLNSLFLSLWNASQRSPDKFKHVVKTHRAMWVQFVIKVMGTGVTEPLDQQILDFFWQFKTIKAIQAQQSTYGRRFRQWANQISLDAIETPVNQGQRVKQLRDFISNSNKQAYVLDTIGKETNTDDYDSTKYQSLLADKDFWGNYATGYSDAFKKIIIGFMRKGGVISNEYRSDSALAGFVYENSDQVDDRARHLYFVYRDIFFSAVYQTLVERNTLGEKGRVEINSEILRDYLYPFTGTPQFNDFAALIVDYVNQENLTDLDDRQTFPRSEQEAKVLCQIFDDYMKELFSSENSYLPEFHRVHMAKQLGFRSHIFKNSPGNTSFQGCDDSFQSNMLSEYVWFESGHYSALFPDKNGSYSVSFMPARDKSEMLDYKQLVAGVENKSGQPKSITIFQPPKNPSKTPTMGVQKEPEVLPKKLKGLETFKKDFFELVNCSANFNTTSEQIDDGVSFNYQFSEPTPENSSDTSSTHSGVTDEVSDSDSDASSVTSETKTKIVGIIAKPTRQGETFSVAPSSQSLLTRPDQQMACLMQMVLEKHCLLEGKSALELTIPERFIDTPVNPEWVLGQIKSLKSREGGNKLSDNLTITVNDTVMVENGEAKAKTLIASL